MDLGQGYIGLAAVRGDAPGRLRRQVEQGANGAAGLGACPQLQHLAQQHQGGDHRRRLEIDLDDALG